MRPLTFPMLLSVPGKVPAKTDRFLFADNPSAIRGLVFFRISVGLLVLLNFLSVYPDIDLLFGHLPIMPAEVTGLYVDDLVISNSKLQSWLGVDARVFQAAFTGTYIVFSITLTTGLFPRVSAAILLLLHTSLMSNNVFFMYGADYFIRMSLFYLVFFSTHHRFSIHPIYRQYRSATGYTIYLRFLQLHLVLIYLFSGVDKAIGYNWRNGEAIWKAINLPHANTDFHINFGWAGHYPWLMLLAGWMTLLTELLYPLIFIVKLRRWILTAVVMMHLSIALVLNLYFFSALMITWNLAAFYDFGAGKPRRRDFVQR